MNTYFITFPFRGKYVFVKANANMLANKFIEIGDACYDFTINKGQYCDEVFYVKNNATNEMEEFQFEFNFKNPETVNVCYSDKYDDDKAGHIIEKNIPWLLLKVEDENKKELYNIGNDWN